MPTSFGLLGNEHYHQGVALRTCAVHKFTWHAAKAVTQQQMAMVLQV